MRVDVPHGLLLVRVDVPHGLLLGEAGYSLSEGH